MSGPRVVVAVSRHAFEQARDRAALDVTDIVRDVRLGLFAGRVSEERPDFLGPGGQPAWGGAFYVWNAAHDRCYVVLEPRSGGPYRRLKVKTVLTPLEQEVAA